MEELPGIKSRRRKKIDSRRMLNEKLPSLRLDRPKKLDLRKNDARTKNSESSEKLNADFERRRSKRRTRSYESRRRKSEYGKKRNFELPRKLVLHWRKSRRRRRRRKMPSDVLGKLSRRRIGKSERRRNVSSEKQGKLRLRRSELLLELRLKLSPLLGPKPKLPKLLLLSCEHLLRRLKTSLAFPSLSCQRPPLLAQHPARLLLVDPGNLLQHCHLELFLVNLPVDRKVRYSFSSNLSSNSDQELVTLRSSSRTSRKGRPSRSSNLNMVRTLDRGCSHRLRWEHRRMEILATRSNSFINSLLIRCSNNSTPFSSSSFTSNSSSCSRTRILWYPLC